MERATLDDPKEKQKYAELVLENEELRRSNQDLERFAYFAAHDLRAPLRHIGSFSELLGEKAELLQDDEAAEWLTLIQKGVGKMNRLTDQLLQLARVGAQKPALEQIDCSQACRDAIETLRWEQISALELVRVEASGSVIANAVHLRSLVQNLVDNALRHGANGGPPEVTIQVSGDQEGWTLKVSDNGPGMKKADQERVFEPFVQLGGGGSGLGLSICSQIVRAYGGSIRAESEPGRGCCMIVRLPTRGPVAD